MFKFDEARASTDAKVIALGTLFASLIPALIESDAIEHDRAIRVFDDAIAGLTPRKNMHSVAPAIDLIGKWRDSLANKNI